MTVDPEEGLMTMRAASQLTHVTRQAIFNAIRKGNLTGQKINGRWYVKLQDLEIYRLNKHNRDLIKSDGDYVFDMEKGHFSVHQVCKVLSATLGHPFPLQRLYYLLRTGQLKGFRKGISWVIEKDDAVELLKQEIQNEGNEKWA